jgi:excisionase family DNA binding protein
MERKVEMDILMNRTENANPLLNAEEVAQELQISIALAYRLIQQKKIRAVRIGRLVRVRKKDLDRFIEQQTSGG